MGHSLIHHSSTGHTPFPHTLGNLGSHSVICQILFHHSVSGLWDKTGVPRETCNHRLGKHLNSLQKDPRAGMKPRQWCPLHHEVLIQECWDNSSPRFHIRHILPVEHQTYHCREGIMSAGLKPIRSHSSEKCITMSNI